MRSIVLALAATLFPLAAHAGENVTYTVDGEAFEGYRDGPPPVNRLTFRVAASGEERQRLLQTGEVHLISGVSPEMASTLRATTDVEIASVKGLRVLFLGLDCSRESSPYVSVERNPLRDPRVRRAIDHAINREALVQGPLQGHGEAASLTGRDVGDDLEVVASPQRVEGVLHAFGRGDASRRDRELADEPAGGDLDQNHAVAVRGVAATGHEASADDV